MSSALRQYSVLAILLVAAFLVQAGNTVYLFQILRHGKDLPADPFTLVTGTRTIANGPLRGDQILAIDGRPFSAGIQFHNAVLARRPGETIRLTLSEPDGSAIEREVPVASQTADLASPSALAVMLARNLVIPFVSLVLGFAVAIIRPRDRMAWIVLLLMIGFTETMRTA
ncbi:MAG TPA: hypothetical protein VEF06_01840, partial [Bryobacteraceae bacterium]|nr:hypothetical protein [Bryobacteraceae bacterium]